MGGDISTLFIHLLYCLRYGNGFAGKMDILETAGVGSNAAQGMFCVYLLVSGHPLQYVYYNFLAGNNVEESYEVDTGCWHSSML